LLFASITLHWRTIRLYETGWPWLGAVGLFALGLWLYWQSAKNFSAQQLGGVPETTSGYREQRLITSGIRSRMRHPVYLAHLCEMLAWSVGTGLVICYGLTAFAVITGAVMIRMEDEELLQRFGKQYQDYHSRVPAIVPQLRRRLR
jgi:methanethiol S-methyltransferase